MQQLPGAFARAQITTRKAKIGINDPHQSKARKVKSFRDHLRSDQQIDLASFHPTDQVGRRRWPCDQVACDHGDARLWEQGNGFFH